MCKAKLREVTTVLSGTTPKSGNPVFWGQKYVWVTPTDLGKNIEYVISSSGRKLTEEGVNSCNLPVVPEGAVVMSSRAPIGHLGIAGCSLFTNQGCKSFVCSAKLNPLFLYFLLKSEMGKIQSLGSGATFAEVSKRTLENFEICFPEAISDQRAIAARLKAQLAEVETARKAAEKQLEDFQLLHSRLLGKLFEDLEKVPRKRIGDGAQTTSGSTPPRGNKAYWVDGTIPWIKTGEIAFEPINGAAEHISPQALSECSLRILPVGTVLVAMYGQGKTRGQSAVLEAEATINQACFAILPNDTWTPGFLQFWLHKSYEDLRSMSSDRGGNQANLNGALLKAFGVPAPSKTVQENYVKRITEALEELSTAREAAEKQLEDLAILPQRILSETFAHLSADESP